MLDKLQHRGGAHRLDTTNSLALLEDVDALRRGRRLHGLVFPRCGRPGGRRGQRQVGSCHHVLPLHSELAAHPRAEVGADFCKHRAALALRSCLHLFDDRQALDHLGVGTPCCGMHLVRHRLQRRCRVGEHSQHAGGELRVQVRDVVVLGGRTSAGLGERGPYEPSGDNLQHMHALVGAGCLHLLPRQLDHFDDTASRSRLRGNSADVAAPAIPSSAENKE
mmetsp:Transcript_79381/g.242897  ORF Transcript_79381/g.242897 Transcript_79381/m.242897 type:complete len:221 (+) Transcript_79381:487-1149(+)